MNTAKKVIVAVFAIASLAAISLLFINWLASINVIADINGFYSQTWFFYVAMGLLAIVAIGLVAVLVYALFAPGKSSRVRIKQDKGEVVFPKRSLQMIAEDTVGSYRDLKLSGFKVKQTGSDKDPSLKLKVKVDPRKNVHYQTHENAIKNVIERSVSAYTGLEVKDTDISFKEPSVTYVDEKGKSTSQDTESFSTETATVQPARAH